MKQLIGCLGLILITTMGSCQCGGGKKNLSNQDFSQIKSFTMLICTANVQYFHTNTPQAVLHALDALRQDQDDIVVFGLQETTASHLTEIKKILPSYEVYDYRIEYKEFANIVAVYNKTQLKIVPNGIALTKYGSTPQRYATIIELPDINFKLANTHLFGGRFDDKQFFYFPNARAQQMADILAVQPTIIMGDFNVDTRYNVRAIKYWNDLINEFLRINPIADQQRVTKDFERYQNSIHIDLNYQGYISLLDRETMKPTSRGQTVTDWIYCSQKLNYSILDSGVIEGIDHLSDHNFPWVRIRIDRS